MAASELLKLWARPPTVSPSVRRSSSRRQRVARVARGAGRGRAPSSAARAPSGRARPWCAPSGARCPGSPRGRRRGAWRATAAPRPPDPPRHPLANPLEPSRERRGGGRCGRGYRVHQLRHPLAMVRRVAERELRALGALEVEVQVVLPREADAAVELDARGGDPPVRVGHVGLGHAHGERALGDALVHRPRRVVGDRLAVLHVHEHVGGPVLDALVRADRPAEGLADLGVLDRHVEHLLGAAAHLGAERDGGAIEHAARAAPSPRPPRRGARRRRR